MRWLLEAKKMLRFQANGGGLFPTGKETVTQTNLEEACKKRDSRFTATLGW